MAGNQQKLNWGLIGCGDVARKRVAKALQEVPRSRLVAACRRNEAELRGFCATFGVERSYRDANSLIADPTVDAVYIATPVREHLPETLAAARAGKHVLVEKPMGLSVAECDEMIAACREANVKLGVAYYRRFYPLVTRIKEGIDNGEIGTPLAVTAVTATPPMKPTDEGYWRVDTQISGGGALMDIGSHRINLFQYLFDEVENVKAICETVAGDFTAEDSAVVSLKFRSGVTGTLQVHFGSAVDPDEFAVLGTNGRLVARPLNGDELLIEAEDGRRTERHPAPTNLCGPLVADFVKAVLDGRPPTVSGEEGRAVNAVIEAAYENAGQRETTKC